MSSHHIPSEQSPVKKPKNAFVFIGSLVILIIIIISFVVAPALDVSGSNVVTLGRYGSETVSTAPDNIFMNILEQYSQMMNSNGNYPDFMHRYIWQMAFGAAMNEAAWLYESKKSGIQTGNRAVADVLNQYGYTREIFASLSLPDRQIIERQLRNDLQVALYKTDITAINRSENFLRLLSSPSPVRRSIEMAVFYGDNYPDAEVAAYARQHEMLFHSIEVRRIFIDANAAEAKRMHTALLNGQLQFDQLAQNQEAAYGPANLGRQYFFQIHQELQNEEAAAQVLALTAGSFSEPLMVAGNKNRYAVYLAVSNPLPPTFTDQAFIDMVRSYILSNEKIVVTDFFSEQAEKINADNFIASAAASGAAAFRTGFFTPVYNIIPNNYNPSPYDEQAVNFKNLFSSQDARLADSLLVNRAFFNAVFSGELNQLSAPLVIDDTMTAVIILKPVAEEPVDSMAVLPNLESFITTQYLAGIEQKFQESSRYKSFFNKGYDKLFPVRENVPEQPQL
jgi:hypothetical protein